MLYKHHITHIAMFSVAVSQLVNAMKTVGYFDVRVVDYKYRYIIIMCTHGLCGIERENFFSLREFPFLEQIKVSSMYRLHEFMIPCLMLHFSLCSLQASHNSDM